MKRNSPLLFLLLLFLAGCSSDTHRKLRLELPSYSTVHPEEFQEMIIVPFLIVGSPEGFDLNQQIASFFIPEFERKLGLSVAVQSVPLDSEDSFRRADFWQTLAPESPGRIYVSGKAELSREIRKSILGEVPGEDPFTPLRKIEERTLFSLSLHLFLIRGDNGEILLDRAFKEVKTYINPSQRTDFAFYDLALRVRTKLFRLISSEERIQERYLLRK